MAFAGHGRFHLAGAGNLEALFSARLGLDLGHLALLSALTARQSPGQPDVLATSVLIERCRRHGSPFGRATSGRFMAEQGVKGKRPRGGRGRRLDAGFPAYRGASTMTI